MSSKPQHVGPTMQHTVLDTETGSVQCRAMAADAPESHKYGHPTDLAQDLAMAAAAGRGAGSPAAAAGASAVVRSERDQLTSEAGVGGGSPAATAAAAGSAILSSEKDQPTPEASNIAVDGGSLAAATGASAVLSSERDQLPAVAPEALEIGVVAGPAATPSSRKVPEHLHEDPSPTSDQPARKLKNEAGTPVPNQRGSHSTQQQQQQQQGQQEETAGAAGGDSTASALPTFSLDMPGHHPVEQYLYCGKKRVGGLLRQADWCVRLTAMGDTCWDCVKKLLGDQWLWFAGEVKKQKSGTKNKNSGHDFRYTVKVVFNYGGQHMQQQQWEQLEESCAEVYPSSEASDKRQLFEAGLGVPALLVDCIFRTVKKKPLSFYARAGLRLHHIECESKEQLDRVSRAMFDVTFVLLLLWHVQDKQQHPELRRVAELYDLRPLQQQQPEHAQQTSTAAARADLQQKMFALHSCNPEAGQQQELESVGGKQ